MKPEFNQPLVSIITPVYNSMQFLESTINSVIVQSYSNWEWILVDDCSTDGSSELLESLHEREPRVRLFRNPHNLGQGKSRNLAIEKASGDFIAFLDSDDLWVKEKLSIQIEYMAKRQVYFTHTSYGYIDEHGDRIKDTFHVSSHPISYRDLLRRTEISCLTAIYDAKNLGKFYMTEDRTKEDYALWLSILKTGVVSQGLDQELAFYRQHGNSTTSKKYRLILDHYTFLKDNQRLGTLQALKYTLAWIINGFLRYYIK